ncbi:MAG: MBOAT family protein [Flavobacteriales bacterium]|nr:MBOAT family protein [Flavobacteriales bacterium]MCB9166447.1 MBOAT family protein [Flavobacteriales bacterium]
MVFSSPVFLFLFLPLTLLFVLLAGRRHAQNTVLLIASLLFYAWGEGAYVILMLAVVLVNYLAGLAIERLPSPRVSLVIAITLNLGALAWFKYANFLVDGIDKLITGGSFPPIRLERIHLPIGVSFFIFQGLSYAVDVYRGQARAQTRPGAVALYISLFPQLIAGPIVRYRDIAAQLEDRRVDVSLFASGVRRFVVGLAKKVLIADQVARIADAVFKVDVDHLPPAVSWLGLVAYAVQIYFDFSGYSDMAIGLGRMFGFTFLENFRRPYIARSVREFWQRWHISLSTWFRDYLYIPLGGNRGGAARTYANLLVVFFLTGLWHGASWNFVVWGLIHGLFMIIERMGFGRVLERLPRPLSNTYLVFVVLLAWVFFRLEDLTEAWHYLLSLFGGVPGDAHLYYPSLFLSHTTALALIIGVLGALDVHAFLARRLGMASAPDALGSGWRGAFEVVGLGILLMLVAMSISASTFSPFIYFRF